MWAYVIGGATIFALIVGLFAIYNGRATRKVIREVISEEGERTREILRELSKQHGELSKQHVTMIKILKSMRVRSKRPR